MAICDEILEESKFAIRLEEWNSEEWIIIAEDKNVYLKLTEIIKSDKSYNLRMTTNCGEFINLESQYFK